MNNNMNRKTNEDKNNRNYPISMKLNDVSDGFALVRIFLQRYLFPLCGKPEDEIQNIEIIFEKNEKGNNNLSDSPKDCDQSPYVEYYFDKSYSIKINKSDIPKESDIDEIFKWGVFYFMDMMRINSSVIKDEFWFETKYNFYAGKKILGLEDKKNRYYNNIYETCVQKSICRYITKNDNSLAHIEKLISILEEWSCKTYEGHKVCFGLLINNGKPESEPMKSENKEYVESFLDFLSDEYSAVLSDGMSSLFKLDSECNLEGFISLSDLYNRNIDENTKIEKIKDSCLPFRFFEIISNYVTDEKTGVFLLQNGDIIIAKDKKILFIKRNGKWMNFSIFAFTNSIRNKLKSRSISISDELLINIYSTALDVSLSHTGGIIAFVTDKEKLEEENIINNIDKYCSGAEYQKLFFDEFKSKYEKMVKVDDSLKIEGLEKNLSNPSYDNKKEIDEKIKDKPELVSLKKDIIKRLTKRYYISQLMDNKNFIDIDRKLRAELIGLDGACILTNKGDIISIGAIITNDSGSSGGGRGAAAKKLSNYSGFAIKISTDGYIEVYSEYKKIYSIK